MSAKTKPAKADPARKRFLAVVAIAIAALALGWLSPAAFTELEPATERG